MKVVIQNKIGLGEDRKVYETWEILCEKMGRLCDNIWQEVEIHREVSKNMLNCASILNWEIHVWQNIVVLYNVTGTIAGIYGKVVSLFQRASYKKNLGILQECTREK